MKARLSVVSEYSSGKTFEAAVENLFKSGLMNGRYTSVYYSEGIEILPCH